MVSAREIQAVAELLQISPEGLQKAITFKVTVSFWAPEIFSKPPASAHTEPLRVPSCGGSLSTFSFFPVPPIFWGGSPQTPKALGAQSPGLCRGCSLCQECSFLSTPMPHLRPNTGISTSRKLSLTPGWVSASSDLPQSLALLPFPRLTSLGGVCSCLYLPH